MKDCLVAVVVSNLTANAGDTGDVGSIPGSGRAPGGGYSNPFQYFCLENPMNGGAWLATVHGVAKSWTRLKRLSTLHSSMEGLRGQVSKSFSFLCT